jgi:hypothetical protein
VCIPSHPAAEQYVFFLFGELAAPVAGESARLLPAPRYTAHDAVALRFAVIAHNNLRQFALN